MNIFLYQVTPNAAYRNADRRRVAPTAPAQRPQAALDLHYLFTFPATSALEPQRLLGAVISTLHSQPLINNQNHDTSRDLGFPARDSSLESHRTRQVHGPAAVARGVSKLWSVFFQVEYSLSTAYQGPSS